MAGISASQPGPADRKDGAAGEAPPYLSLVVTARNDDHGGNLLGRMQVFVNAWIGQAKAHNLSSELILVEWNPPGEKPRLSEALQWPADLGPCQVRVIEVPPDVHACYRHAEALPIYQMIAKNVGIRRARGKFILATNIDIVFSSELVRHLAGEPLVKGRMYRIDRHDAMSDVPLDASLDDQLAYCRNHLIRLNAREGTFNLTREGFLAPSSTDITTAGIRLGRGWFPVERFGDEEPYRWLADEAELNLALRSSPATLVLDIEPGPGVRGESGLRILDENRAPLNEVRIGGRGELHLILQSTVLKRTLYLRATGAGAPAEHDPRALNFRVLRCRWGKPEGPKQGDACAVRFVYTSKIGLSQGIREWILSRPAYRFCRQAGGPLRAIGRGILWLLRQRAFVAQTPEGRDIFQPGAGIIPGKGWYAKEHYLGETFRWVRNDAELILSVSDEHAVLGIEIEPGPGVKHQPFELLVRDGRGEIVSRCRVGKLDFLRIPLRLSRDTQTITLSIEGGGVRLPNEERILNFRLFWCGWVDRNGRPMRMETVERKLSDAPSEPQDPVDAETTPVDPATRPASHRNAAFLHTNGCGDFTLMAKEHWFDLRGYPEFDLFSMNLDSVLCYAAHHAGVREEMLQEPMRIYHIEHGTGSGWTPEGQARLFERIAAKGLSFVDYPQVVRWINDMRRFDSPIIFNLDNWGLADLELTEQVVGSRSQARAGD